MTVKKSAKALIPGVGEAWPEAYIDVVRASTELEFASRTVIVIVVVLLVAFTVSMAALFAGVHRAYPIDILSSVGSTILSLVAAVLAYRSARIASRVERSLASAVSEDEGTRADESESIILLRVLEVFGDSERAVQWMRESNPALNDETPIRVIQSEDGRREVLNILGRIQHGIIS